MIHVEIVSIYRESESEWISCRKSSTIAISSFSTRKKRKEGSKWDRDEVSGVMKAKWRRFLLFLQLKLKPNVADLFLLTLYYYSIKWKWWIRRWNDEGGKNAEDNERCQGEVTFFYYFQATENSSRFRSLIIFEKRHEISSFRLLPSLEKSILHSQDSEENKLCKLIGHFWLLLSPSRPYS